MADVKISELPVGATLTGTEEIPMAQSGATVKMTAQDIANLAAPTAGVSSVVAGSGISVDNTDPSNPIVSATGGGGIPDAPSDGNLYGRKDGDWEQVPGGGGSGDVTGPSSSVPDSIAVFDGSTGKVLKDGGYTIAELRNLALLTSENVQTGTSYTLVLADAFKMVAMNNAAANTLTVPPNSAVAFPVGTRIDLSQDGAGQTTIAAGSGVTIRTPETLKLRKQWAKATLIKRTPDTWDVEGNLEAAP